MLFNCQNKDINSEYNNQVKSYLNKKGCFNSIILLIKSHIFEKKIINNDINSNDVLKKSTFLLIIAII